MSGRTQDFLKDLDVRELLDISPEVRRYLLREIPDLLCRGGQTLEAVASLKGLDLKELLRGIHHELHKAAAEETNLGTNP